MMKHIIIIIVLCCFNSFGQEERRSISATFCYGFTDWMHTQSTGLIGSFNAGIEIRQQLKSSGFYVQTGLRWNEYGYSDEGINYSWTGEGFDMVAYDYRATHFYLTIPIIATYKLKKIIQGLTFSAGPQFSFYTFTKSGFNDDLAFHTGRAEISNLGVFSSLGYEKNIGDHWILGGEVYSNFNFPIAWYFGAEGYYNFGLAVTGRFLLQR
jgi:hypothetical protein